MKVATGPVGLGMLKAWGTYEADPNANFNLCEFVDMIEELPNIRKFCAMLAKLHHDSMASKNAPTDFGFPVVTYEGNMYQDLTWCTTWKEPYTLPMIAFIDQERISQGSDRELDELLPLEKAIPRLLRPFQSHGRNVKPVLVHGGLWYGSTAKNEATRIPLMFDPSVFWGHDESKYLPI